jgi:acetylornithine aminotransferase
MKLFDVYPINDVTIAKAKGSYVWDDQGQQYLDLYGGHAVISIGHNHTHWVSRIEDQLEKIAFYSNSIRIPLQQELAEKLGKISGKEDYQLFLCNSGAEANENALKLASFHNGRKKSHCLQQKLSWQDISGCGCYRQQEPCCTCKRDRECDLSSLQ